jgi:transposase
MVYIGIDLHRKRSQVAALDGNGELLFNRRVATRADELFKAIGDAGEEPVEVVFEATFGWGWLADMLAEAGIPTHMAHPLATKAISSARVKNDSVDAKTLAHLLRTNLLPEAWLAPPPAREARRLVRMRAGLVRIRTKLKNQIHAVLGEHGVEVGMTEMALPLGTRPSFIDDSYRRELRRRIKGSEAPLRIRGERRRTATDRPTAASQTACLRFESFRGHTESVFGSIGFFYAPLGLVGLTGNLTGSAYFSGHLTTRRMEMGKRANGCGAIYLRGDGTWECQLRLPAGGRKSVYARTRRDPLRKLREARWMLAQGLPVSSRNQTLRTFLTSWPEVVRHRIRPSTYDS